MLFIATAYRLWWCTMVCCTCRDPEKDLELTTVIFNAFRERYHKVAGIVLGDDGSEDVSEFKQRLSQEELHCTFL
jgi:hypothetical protein